MEESETVEREINCCRLTVSPNNYNWRWQVTRTAISSSPESRAEMLSREHYSDKFDNIINIYCLSTLYSLYLIPLHLQFIHYRLFTHIWAHRDKEGWWKAFLLKKKLLINFVLDCLADLVNVRPSLARVNSRTAVTIYLLYKLQPYLSQNLTFLLEILIFVASE